MCVCVLASGYQGGSCNACDTNRLQPPPMTSPPYPGAHSTTAPDPRGACKRGFQLSPCISDVGLCGSSWWAVPQSRLFCSVRSSTYISQTGSSEFLAISNTGHFGPSGEKVFSGFDVVHEDTKIHCTLLWCDDRGIRRRVRPRVLGLSTAINHHPPTICGVAMKWKKENGRWTKRPQRTLGKGCKRRTMHHVTIN
jgi:hypothetical protein